MRTVSSFENQNGKIQADFEIVDKHDLLSKLIETSKSKDKPIVVQNNQKQIIGVITQSDLLKAVIEDGDGE
jgi:glycine betaine/proline transport system ATP-binding protein